MQRDRDVPRHVAGRAGPHDEVSRRANASAAGGDPRGLLDLQDGSRERIEQDERSNMTWGVWGTAERVPQRVAGRSPASGGEPVRLLDPVGTPAAMN